MPFQVELTRRAEKDLDRLDPKIRQRVVDKLAEIQSDPFRSSRKLTGQESLFRTRVSDWRIVFLVDAERIIIQRVLHRREIYQRL